MTFGRIKNYLFYTLIGLLGVLIALPAAAQDPYSKPDNTWISIDGTVKTVARNMFTLDYGDGMITVEMDDSDRDADAYVLDPGDKVTVFGKIDDDFFEATTIEAASVYVEKLGTHFYASSMDENDRPFTFGAFSPPVIVSSSILRGVVTDVNNNHFTLNTGSRAIDVNVAEMSYNPLDDEGYQQIDTGDRVWVSGKVDHNLFSGRQFLAESVEIIRDASNSQS